MIFNRSATHRSGHALKAIEGVEELRQLMSVVKDTGLTIVPASGIGQATIRRICGELPDLTEVHLSSGRPVEPLTCVPVEPLASAATQKGDGMGFGREEWKLDVSAIHNFFDTLASCKPQMLF